ncbi:MAG: CvpA family protein [Dehalococcoidia bacterium]
MNSIDYVLLVIILLSAYSGMKIGILKTAFSIGGIFLGWLLAGQFSPHLGEIISQSIRNDTIITVISYALIIIATLMVFNYSYKIVKPILSIATLGFSNLIDKIGGIILGLLIGTLIASIIIVGITRFTYDFEIPKNSMTDIVTKEIQFLKVNKSIENNIADSVLSTNILKIVQKIPASTFGLIPNDFKTSIQLFSNNNE